MKRENGLCWELEILNIASVQKIREAGFFFVVVVVFFFFFFLFFFWVGLSMPDVCSFFDSVLFYFILNIAILGTAKPFQYDI